MKALRGRYTSHFLRRRRESQKALQVETHWLDIWLPRISHLSQFGLFAITVGSLYFVVLPLYQKAVLEESIARNGIELAASEKALEQNYSRVRKLSVNELIFFAGAKCSGLTLPSYVLHPLDKKGFSRHSYTEEILEINASECLKEAFQKDLSLKELRSTDIKTLSSHIERIAADLKAKQDATWKEYSSLPLRAKEDVLILKQRGFFSEHSIPNIQFMSNPQFRAWSDAGGFSSAVEAVQSDIGSAYATYVRDKIITLRTIEWGSSK